MGESTDFLIVGGGVIGLNLALEAKRRHPDQSVTLLEKEPDCGHHASGRNSGVLHAGFYYTADSLKARFCRDGNRLLTEYCLERGLRINRCGKLVVARNAHDLPVMDELLARGRANGVTLEPINAEQALEIEPRVRTFERALFSPTTASVDPAEVVGALIADARAAGVKIRAGEALVGWENGTARTSSATIPTGYLINAAGLYADRLARQFGFGADMAILPFKGLYLYCDEPPGAFRTNIYPVPDLANPFLGVHYTLTVDNHAKIGPTAIPAFWREHYGGLDGFDAGEFAEIILREMGLMVHNRFGFRRLALREMRKHNRSVMARMAAELASGVDPAHYRRWGKPGIRAQLVDLKRRQLVNDFRYEGDERSFHILNAVSPGFTCATPFARHLFDRIESIQR